MSTHHKQLEERLGIKFEEYMLIKKYILGTSAIQKSYQYIKDGINIHRQLITGRIKIFYEKENKGMVFKVKLPFQNVTLGQLKLTRSGTNKKEGESILKNITKCIGKPVLINFYSDIGDQAMMATSFCYEMLDLNHHKGIVTNGVELNQLSVDFENSSIDDLLKKEFLIINAINSMYVTEFRKNFIENLLMAAKLRGIPIITSSNTILKYEGIKVLNIKLTDDKKSQAEIITDLFEEKEK